MRTEFRVEITRDNELRLLWWQCDLVLGGEDESEADARLTGAHVLADDAAGRVVVVNGFEVSSVSRGIHVKKAPINSAEGEQRGVDDADGEEFALQKFPKGVLGVIARDWNRRV